MAVPWAWAFDAPFPWAGQVASHLGGTRQGMAISWPKAIKDKGGLRHQFHHHIINVVPTVLEAAQVRQPEVVDGTRQGRIEGVSMMYTFDAKNANATSTHKTQYFGVRPADRVIDGCGVIPAKGGHHHGPRPSAGRAEARRVATPD
jgi:arylsulfatase